MKTPTFVPLVALAFAACTAQSGQLDVAAEQAAVQAVEMTFLEFARQQDAAGAANLFTEDAVIFRENREPAIGISAVRAALEEEYQSTNPNSVQTSEVRYTQIAPSGDLAFQYGMWTTTGGGASGAEDDRGHYLSVYRKVNGTWKFAVDMSLSTTPEPQTP